MAKFAYAAVDPDGRDKKGILKASDIAEAREALKARGLLVTQLDEQAAAKPKESAGGLSLSRKPKLKSKQLMLFTRQLSSLMQVSPLEESLATISRQSERAEVRTVLGHVHDGVVEGQTLADAMRREPKSFPPVYRAMISAGESSGSLPGITERLSDLLEKQAAIRGKIISALAYPAALAVVAIAVVIGLMVSVVPRIVEQFQSAGDDRLPTITKIVIAISNFLANWWWLLLALIVLAGLALFQALKNEEFRYRFDGMLLKLPFIGRLIRDVHAARLARTLATMVASRLPLLDGLQLTSRTIRNTVLRRSLDEIVERIRGGGSLSGALRHAGYFPPLLVYLTASGEASGQLDLMLERAADYLEREFENFTSTVLSLLEPAIIVIMGGLVAIIILSILLPILQLQDLAGI
ncbi:type II secretion system inner membrane protein GspF [Alterisphingorhabdus coralli]|uniref:General secretion pathway protein F n=1 Tax=Alterisphingorhabdus coralli TaxID=3071408 RepID=A0AA97I1Z5_9SPHN|nr:type II secretion system inner membrane protein GspF [Parasphingorhabdus sp. SCSIO 66989]WOE75840.1 type II secretion system inner membrane protein GspF [Parasphingorhabdus sp. SCSIO 66989]